jgi:transcriptional regulator of heat shock response
MIPLLTDDHLEKNNQGKLTIDTRNNIAKEYLRLAGLPSLTSMDSARLAVILELAMSDDALDSIIQKCDELFIPFYTEEIKDYRQKLVTGKRNFVSETRENSKNLLKEELELLIQAISVDNFLDNE